MLFSYCRCVYCEVNVLMIWCSLLSQREAKKSKYPNGTDFSIPLNGEKVRTLMRYTPSMYNVSRITDSYYRFIEVALGYWLTQGNRSYSSYNYVTYGNLLGGSVDVTDPRQKLNFQGNPLPGINTFIHMQRP